MDYHQNYSDCGPHFRCNRVLAHSAIVLPEKFKIHFESIWGCECHGKSDVDAHMGLMRQQRHAHAVGAWLRELKDIIDLRQARDAERKVLIPELPIETYVEFLPGIAKKDFISHLLIRKSLCMPIKS